jgi:urease accessory protein
LTSHDLISIAGLWDGFTHPLLGVDHLLAMISVGVASALLGPRAIWALPISFVASMALAGIAGLNGLVLPRSELWIAVSLVALGLTISTGGAMGLRGRRIPTSLAGLFVMIFGAAHGNAHGLEIPSTASPAAFTVGFLVGTTGLHLAGVAAGLSALRNRVSAFVLRMAGVFTAAMGVGLLAR